MSDGSESDIPDRGVSSEEEKSELIGDQSRSSGVLIEAEQGENDDLVVSSIEGEEEKVVESDDEDFTGSESSEESQSNPNSTFEGTQTSIEEFLEFPDFVIEGVPDDPVHEPVSIELIPIVMTRFRTTARSEVDRVVVDVVKKASERHSMTPKDKTKLRDDAIKGMETKFETIELFSQTDSIEHLETINDVALMMGDVIKRFKRYDMMDVFKLHLPSTADATIPRETVELVTMYATTSLEKVCESVEFFRTWGQDYDLENINWTLEFLENSCENDLRTKVLEQMNALPEVKQGGPTFFKIMMNLVTTTTDNAIRALTKRVMNLDLKTLPGENVTKATSLIRATLQRLETCGKTPPDIAHKLLEVFQSSSVEKFNKTFENLEILIQLDDSRLYTTDKILTLADEVYAQHAEIWPHDAKIVGSTFMGDSDTRECWNCGKKGHMSRDCPDPKRDTSGGYGRGRGYGRGGGRFGGRGGRGYGRDSGGNVNGDEKQEYQGGPWYRKPPKRDEPHEQVRDGRTYFWCGKQECSNWNTTHGTTNHTPRVNAADDANDEAPLATEKEDEEEGTSDKRVSFSGKISAAVLKAKEKI
jgi:ribosomal protein L15